LLKIEGPNDKGWVVLPVQVERFVGRLSLMFLSALHRETWSLLVLRSALRVRLDFQSPYHRRTPTRPLISWSVD